MGHFTVMWHLRGGSKFFLFFFWQIPTSTVISMWEITKKGVQMLKKPSIWLNFVSRAQIVLPEGKFWNFEKKNVSGHIYGPFSAKPQVLYHFGIVRSVGIRLGGTHCTLGKLGALFVHFLRLGQNHTCHVHGLIAKLGPAQNLIFWT